MSLVEILVIFLIVVALYKIVVWGLAKLRVTIDQDLLVIGAVLLLIAALLGKIKLGF